MNKNKLFPLMLFGVLMVGVIALVGMSTSTANAGYIDRGIESTAGDTINLGGIGEVSISFPNNFSGNGNVKSVIPNYAKGTPLPGNGKGYQAFYIRTVSKTGASIFDGYSICFRGPGSLYKFVGSAWSLMATYSDTGKYCYSTSGGGAFVFVK